MAGEKQGAGGTNADKITRYLNGLLAGKVGVFRLELIHSTGRSGGPALLIRECDPGEGVDADGLGKELAKLAKDDAQGHGGAQSYTLKAFSVEDDSRPLSQIVIRAEGGDGLPQADGSPQNTIAHLLKHLEAKDRVTYGFTEKLVDRYDSQNARLNERCNKLEDKITEFYGLIEDMTQHRHERELAIAKEKKSEERKDMALARFIPVMMAIVTKLAGQDTGSMAFEALKELLTSFDDKQVENLAGMLKPEQMPLFETLLAKVQAEKEAKGDKS